MSVLSSISIMFLFLERTMVLWLIHDWVVIIFSSLWFRRHVFHIEHLTHVHSKDEWFVFEPTIVKIHSCHLILLVDCYPTSSRLYPLAPEQRNFKISYIVETPQCYGCILSHAWHEHNHLHKHTMIIIYLGTCYFMCMCCLNCLFMLSMLVFEYDMLLYVF